MSAIPTLPNTPISGGPEACATAKFESRSVICPPSPIEMTSVDKNGGLNGETTLGNVVVSPEKRSGSPIAAAAVVVNPLDAVVPVVYEITCAAYWARVTVGVMTQIAISAYANRIERGRFMRSYPSF